MLPDAGVEAVAGGYCSSCICTACRITRGSTSEESSDQ
jgi:hypothetical protein